MEDTKDIDVRMLVEKIHVMCPDLPKNKEFNTRLQSKLKEQIKDKVPRVELEHLELKYIIQNVKNSLSEFQKRIDESVAQQQLRRTTRVRKDILGDTILVQNFNSQHYSKLSSPSPSTSNKAHFETLSSTKKCHKSESDLVALVQVESLPVSASTNLVTIFVPTILQEKLHSVKYKISIDLNHLDMTKKILDLNLSQIESNLKENPIKAAEISNRENPECKVTSEIKDDNDLLLGEGKSEPVLKNSPQVELTVPNEPESKTSVESVVCIIEEKGDEKPKATKYREPKRKNSKPVIGPPKKRGRKPGSKNKTKTEKSELAKYVEMFECNGNSPSSAVSQTVTSTTQNWDVLPDQSAQIAYFMNGEWTTLNAPPNNMTPAMVSTSNGNLGDAAENENFIPFDDFVNFIDNQTFDIGNNVIARVLEGAVDTHEVLSNIQQNSGLNLGVDNNQAPKGDTSTKKDIGGILPPVNIDVNSNDLNMTKIQDSDNVIFSTCRSMPSLDIEEGDLFCSTPQSAKISDNIIAFSMKTNGDKPGDNILSNQLKDNLTDFENVNDKRGKLQSTIDSSGVGENSKNTKCKAKVNGEVVKEMSLLEIEKDFDDCLLDFENCLEDDLLSLAPSSCFNSPNDDRFADSNFLAVEEPKNGPCTESMIDIPGPAPRSHLETTLVATHESEINPTFKKFKIPRLKQIQEANDCDETFTDKFPCRPNDIGTTNVDSVLRPNSARDLKSPNLSLNISSKTKVVENNMMSTHEISKIFGSICHNFLADMCTDGTCKYNHQLLDLGIITISVSLLRNEVLNFAYRFIMRHNKLFKLYFPIFCEEYGRRNIRQKLSTMVTDCQQQPKCTLFLKNIYKTLIICGNSKINACRFVLSRVRDRNCMTINILLEIIIESDAQMFAFAIEEFTAVEGYKFSMKNINELATICLRSGSTELVPAIIKCLINIEQTEFLTMRSPELIQLLEIVKSSDRV